MGPAREALQALTDDGAFDFAFIDADKTAYPDYFEQAPARCCGRAG